MKTNLSNLSVNESGTGAMLKPSPSVNKDNFQSSKWKGNYHLKCENSIESFESIFSRIEQNIIPLCEHYIFGEEYGESGDTPHIEFAFTIKGGKRMRRDKLLKLFSHPKHMFLDKMKGNLQQQDYCKKEGNKVITNIKFTRPLALMERKFLNEEQLSIVDKFEEFADPLWSRELYWFYEKEGGWGKSTVALHLVDFCDAILMGGANNDILFAMVEYLKAHGGEAPKTIVFDIPRVNGNSVSYSAIESIKNGVIFSPKYESGMVRFNRPHIIVFSNQYPETHKMSEDRWIIENLNKDDSDDETQYH